MIEPRPRLRDRAILVGAVPKRGPIGLDEPLEELALLARTLGLTVLERVIQRMDRPRPRSFYGRGKVSELAERARALGADVIISDCNLAPAQVRNLERETGVRVADRTELILDIFASHARTRQARLQVELAQMEYALPRLRRMWTHLERIEGGTGATGGPGEKQLELDRRMIERRIADLRRELEVLEARQGRTAQARSGEFRVALVGYTNAGKSTLLNRLTHADVLVADQLFSTLDTRTRAWRLGGAGRVLVSDTVGFVRNLPHHLVASFHATLEEVRQADLLVHVVDASARDPEAQIAAVQGVLREIGCDGHPTLPVFNKCDAVDRVDLNYLRGAHPDGVFISARGGAGIEDLAGAVRATVDRHRVEVELRLPLGDGRPMAFLEARGQVLRRDYGATHVTVRARLLPRDLGPLREGSGLILGGAASEEPPPRFPPPGP
ncbi:MAG: GTPase HflX [Planctomycetes bacterium]|nr:GTPase HflX [Planctomycetota bacterium]